LVIQKSHELYGEQILARAWSSGEIKYWAIFSIHEVKLSV
jgi:hypothetical protein